MKKLAVAMAVVVLATAVLCKKTLDVLEEMDKAQPGWIELDDDELDEYFGQVDDVCLNITDATAVRDDRYGIFIGPGYFA